MDKIIKLQSSEGKVFKVPETVIRCSQTINTMLEDLGIEEDDDGALIPLPNVNSDILERVIKWAEHHKDAAPPVEDNENKDRTLGGMDKWDEDFLKVDVRTLLELISAANNLNIKGLMEVTCKTVASMMIGKSAEEIRNLFGIKNVFTDAEEEQVRMETEWFEEM